MFDLKGRGIGLAGLACVVATCFAGVGCGGSQPSAASPSGGGSGQATAEVGKPAPDLSIQGVDGKSRISLADMSGKIVIVDFWATWCAPCKTSFPKLEALQKQNEGKLQIIGVSVDDKLDGVADFAKENGATFKIGWDDKHENADRWKVSSMPTTYVVDASGTVRFVHAGFHDNEPEELAKEVATLTSEGSKGKADTAVAKNDKPETTSDSAAPTGTGTTSTTSGTTSDPPAAGDKTPTTDATDPKPAPTASGKPKKGGKGGTKGAAPKKGGGAKPKKKPAGGTTQ